MAVTWLAVMLGMLAILGVIVAVVLTISLSRGAGSPTADNPNLFPCPDCGRLISIRAATCPHCGGPTVHK